MTDLKLTGQCIDGECYDDVLFHNLDSYIDNLQQDGIIVLHTIGSHGPTYYNRYPAEFKKFTPTCDTNEIQSCTQQQLTNTYDNTILYVDYVVDKAIKLLQSKQDKFTTSLVYLSDHGESLGENGVYLHGLPYSIAPDTQSTCPCCCGCRRITSNVTVFPASVCNNRLRRRIIHKIICSPPCSACSASAPTSTRRQMIF